jgi:hypothetical protein
MSRKEAEEYVKHFHESLRTLPSQISSARIVARASEGRRVACVFVRRHTLKNTGETEGIRLLSRTSKGRLFKE